MEPEGDIWSNKSKTKCIDYLNEAERIFELNEDTNSLVKLRQHKMEIINKDNESDDESFNKIYDEDEEEGK